MLEADFLVSYFLVSGAVVVLASRTRVIKSVITGQTPVTLERESAPARGGKYYSIKK